jgi:hypothetical protein
MYLLHATNSDRQTQLLNVLREIAIFWDRKIKKYFSKILLGE